MEVAQSFHDAMRLFCDAPTTSGAKTASPDVKATTLAKYITYHIVHPRVLALVTADVNAIERQRMAKKLIADSKLNDCDILEFFTPSEESLKRIEEEKTLLEPLQ